MPKQIAELFSCIVEAPFGAMGIRVESGELRELTYLPPVRMAPRRNTQNMPVIVANPFRQFGGQPAKDGMRCSVLVRDPLATRLILGVADQLLTSRGVICSHVSPHSGWFQKMNVQAIFAIVVMTCCTPLATCLGL